MTTWRKVGCCFIAAVAAVGARADGVIPASAYVQDGLIAHWDGIENGGTGLHVDVSENGWKDLVGGCVLEKRLETGGQVTTGDHNVILSANAALQTYDEGGRATFIANTMGTQASTLELAGQEHAQGVQNMWFLLGNADDTTMYHAENRIFGWYTEDNKVLKTITYAAPNLKALTWKTSESLYPLDKDFTVAFVTEDIASSSKVCVDGEVRYSSGVCADRTSRSATKGSISLHAWCKGPISATDLDFSSIRIYSRALDSAELAFNTALDQARFKKAEVSTVRMHEGKVQVLVKASNPTVDTEASVSIDGGAAAPSVEKWVDQGESVRLVAMASSQTFQFLAWGGAGAAHLSEEQKTSADITVKADIALALSPEFSIADPSGCWVCANGELTNTECPGWVFNATLKNGNEVTVSSVKTSGTAGLVDFTRMALIPSGAAYATAKIVGFGERLFRDAGSSSTVGSSVIVEVRIPTTVTEIPVRMCGCCANLERVVMHEGIKRIGTGAFQKCPKLSLVEPFLPDGLEYLGQYAFQQDAALAQTVKLGSFKDGAKPLVFEDSAELGDVVYFDNSGVPTFEFGLNINKLPYGLMYMSTAAKDIVFHNWTPWSPASTVKPEWYPHTFSADSSRDYKMRLTIVKKSDEWAAWMADEANFTPWKKCDAATKQKYYDNFGANAPRPTGLSSAASTCRRMWVFYPKTSGMILMLK